MISDAATQLGTRPIRYWSADLRHNFATFKQVPSVDKPKGKDRSAQA